MKKIKTIFLASSSPRRKMLLKQIASNFKLRIKILKPNPDTNMEKLELPNKNESPGRYVKRIALKKAITAKRWMLESKKKYHSILTADTTVALDNLILGKPSFDIYIDDKNLGFNKNWYKNFNLK